MHQRRRFLQSKEVLSIVILISIQVVLAFELSQFNELEVNDYDKVLMRSCIIDLE